MAQQCETWAAVQLGLSIRVRRRAARIAVLTLVVTVLALMCAPAAGAAPRNVGEIPAHLQKYVPDSPEWNAAPWTTSAACRDKGGEYSAWAVAVIVDTPELLRVFNAQLFGAEAPETAKPLADAILAGYRQLAADLQGQVPAGYCIDDIKRWAGDDRRMKPFGFAWGTTGTTNFSCTDSVPGVRSEEDRNKWVGAERGPCDGFAVSCERAGADNRCNAWNEFSKDYTDRVYNIRATAINDHPATGEGDVDTRLKSPTDIANDVAEGWFAQLATAIAKGAATLLAEAMTFWTTTDRSSMLKTPAIKTVQDMLWYVGVVLLVGSVMWQGIKMLYKRKPDPLVNVGLGLLSFIGWSTLGGTVAILMYEAGLALTAQILDEAIDRFSNTMAVAMQANVVAAVAVVFFLAIILFILACIQWFLGFFRMAALVILLALIPLAAAGQLNEATKPWISTTTSWALVIIWYQPVSGSIFAVGLVFIGDGTDIATIMTGVCTLVLAVLSMPALHRFFDWGGRAFASGGSGGGGAMVAGAAASMVGGGGALAHSRYMDQSGPGGRGGPGGGEPSSGAPPVVSAHVGDRPSDRPLGGDVNGPRGGGTTRPGTAEVMPALTGTSAGGPATSGASTVAGPSDPGGAAVVAAQTAQFARDRVAEAMTDGAPPPAEGDRGA